MSYADNSKFKNHGDMIYELRLASVKGISDKLPEADLIYQFNLQFLANRHDHMLESRAKGINYTRGPKGNFK